ncbi:uncharacterized protein LOC144010106 isoform X2 [Festucalex cinctus]
MWVMLGVAKSQVKSSQVKSSQVKVKASEPVRFVLREFSSASNDRHLCDNYPAWIQRDMTLLPTRGDFWEEFIQFSAGCAGSALKMGVRSSVIQEATSGQDGFWMASWCGGPRQRLHIPVPLGKPHATLSPKSNKDFEHVELPDTERENSREKTPRRIIHFSSGETMEEYSTDEEEEEEDEEKEPERKDLLSPSVDASKMTWGPYFWFHMWRAASSTISACDYLGERMASLFGITSAKYQYAIDEYNKMKKEKEEEKEENRLAEEAERSFEQAHFPEGGDPVTRIEISADVTQKIQNENQPPSDAVVVPALVTPT